MSDSNSGMTGIVAIIAIIAILVVGYFAVQMFMNQQSGGADIEVNLPSYGNQ